MPLSFPRSQKSSRAGRRGRSGRRSSVPSFVERLEDRMLLSTLVVTNTLDSGAGSLRQVIIDLNADTTNQATDTINFAIPGAGVHTIRPLTDLPTMAHPVFIDGYSQPGSSLNTKAVGEDAVLNIEIDGTLDSLAGGGLRQRADHHGRQQHREGPGHQPFLPGRRGGG
jgi:hypothetical protein